MKMTTRKSVALYFLLLLSTFTVAVTNGVFFPFHTHGDHFFHTHVRTSLSTNRIEIEKDKSTNVGKKTVE